MKRVGFIFDDMFLRHEPPVWHPDSGERLVRIVLSLKADGLWQKLHILPPRSAGLEDLARVHAPAYLETIRTAQPGELDPDTFISECSFEAALHAAGAVMEAIEQCRRGTIDGAFCAVRPPGHHAETNQALGFCIVNNVAVGARYAQVLGYKKVFIIDFDAHHGNGTQHIFEADDSVFYFSTHQHPYYPETGRDMERGTGQGLGFTYNMPVPAGSGNRDYLYIYQDILPGVLNRFGPDLVLVSAGYDIHVNDPHADIRITNDGIRAMVHSILCCCRVPLVFVLEGGYNLTALADSVVITIEEMLKDCPGEPSPKPS